MKNYYKIQFVHRFFLGEVMIQVSLADVGCLKLWTRVDSNKIWCSDYIWFQHKGFCWQLNFSVLNVKSGLTSLLDAKIVLLSSDCSDWGCVHIRKGCLAESCFNVQVTHLHLSVWLLMGSSITKYSKSTLKRRWK